MQKENRTNSSQLLYFQIIFEKSICLIVNDNKNIGFGKEIALYYQKLISLNNHEVQPLPR